MRDAAAARRESVVRLGLSSGRSCLLALLEAFVTTVQTLGERRGFVGAEEVQEIHAFSENLAVGRGLPITSL
jgi:hypothetical protein